MKKKIIKKYMLTSKKIMFLGTTKRCEESSLNDLESELKSKAVKYGKSEKYRYISTYIAGTKVGWQSH